MIKMTINELRQIIRESMLGRAYASKYERKSYRDITDRNISSKILREFTWSGLFPEYFIDAIRTQLFSFSYPSPNTGVALKNELAKIYSTVLEPRAEEMGVDLGSLSIIDLGTAMRYVDWIYNWRSRDEIQDIIDDDPFYASDPEFADDYVEIKGF